MSLVVIRSYTHKVSQIRLLKHELNKDDINGHATVNWEKPTRPQPDTKKKLQATEESWERRGGLLQRKAHQLAIQCPIVSPENIHTSNTVPTEQVILRNIYLCVYKYVHTHMHAIIISEKIGHVFEGE